MTVAELQAWLSQQHPDSPVCIMGITETGESVYERDINLSTGQGPSDDVDEVVVSWVATPGAEARYTQRTNPPG